MRGRQTILLKDRQGAVRQDIGTGGRLFGNCGFPQYNNGCTVLFALQVQESYPELRGKPGELPLCLHQPFGENL